MSKFTESCVDPKSNVTSKDLMKVFWRQFPIHATMNYERMQGMGFCNAVIPALRKIYKDRTEDFKAALARHMNAFNCTLAMAPFIMGISIAMEEQYAKSDGEIDPAAINQVKSALMGPLSGIGDTFFWGVFRVVAAGIGVTFALQGSILGAIVFLLLFNLPNLLVRYYGLFIGYKQGSSFMEKMSKTGQLSLITHCAGIVGVCVIGAMIALNVGITTPFIAHIGETEIIFQDIFDQLLPKFLPLVCTLGIYGVLRKNVKSTTLLVAIALIGFALGAIGLL